MAERTQFDVVIIGSGGGGAPIAHELVKNGKTVLVLEKGPLFVPQNQSKNGISAFRRDELIADGFEKIIKVAGMANEGISYYSSHIEPDINDEPHVYYDCDKKQDRATIEGYTTQVVGGGTQIYGGVSFRFTPTDFRLQTFNASRSDIANDPNGDVKRNARDWPISYEEFEPYYCKAEKLIGINGERANQQKPFSDEATYQPPLEPNGISKYAKAGMEKLGKELSQKMAISPYRTPLAVITRDHAPSGRKVPSDPETLKTSYVNRFGDPLGCKSSTWAALLSPLRERENFEIRCNSIATRLTCEGRKVNKVFYLDPCGVEHFVEGKLVIVACSGIETIRLLKLSALQDSQFDKSINQNNLLGKYFLTHCFGGASALVPGRFDKSEALDADWATDCCAVEEFLLSHHLWAGSALYNNTSDQALPISFLRTHGAQDLDTLWEGFRNDRSLKGQKLIDFFDEQFGRGLSITFMANQLPVESNRIELHPTVKDKWNRPVAYILKTWHSHDRYLMDVMAEQCGKILRYGAEAFEGSSTCLGQGGVYTAENALARIANHILGGVRFGSDRKDSVLDKYCKAWDFDNLYIADGSFMPSSGSGNPTLTIEANSFRIADHLISNVL